MFGNNPFADAKKMYENMTSEEQMKLALAKKREYHLKLVEKGELTQKEFDELERKGEFGTVPAEKTPVRDPESFGGLDPRINPNTTKKFKYSDEMTP